MSKKNEERASNFRPSKKARVVDIANKQEVSINIGIMELNEEAVGIPLRGKSLPLKIPKEVDYDTLLASALKKRGDYDKTFDCERAYKLVYPDGQSAQTIPGSFELFTLVNYKQGLGKSYGRLTLYLCPIFPISNSAKVAEELRSDNDSDGSVGLPPGIKAARPTETILPFLKPTETIVRPTETILINDETDNNNPSPTGYPEHNDEDSFYSTDFLPIGICENEAIEEAIRQSIEQHSADTEEVQEVKTELTEAELVTRVKEHSDRVVCGNTKAIVLSRLNLWKTALPYFKRNGFLNNPGLICVTFATFTEEEDAVDLGGPRREFFHLLLVAICKDSGILTSTSAGFIARCNIKCLQNHDYLTVGQMLATMIVQGGEQPCLFTKSICDYISMGLDASNPGIEEVPDYTIRDHLKKLSDANTKEGLEAVFNECEWRFEIDGLPRTITLEDKESFVMQVAKYFAIIKCKPMLDQLIEGLKYFEVFDLMSGNQDMTYFLLLKKTTPLTAKQVVRILRPAFSPPGNNRRIQEEVVMTKFVEFLGLCEENALLQRLEEDGHELTLEQKKFIPMVTPTHILMFSTGACGIPAIGFHPTPSCCFVHDESKAIPCAQTCSNILYLYVNKKTVEGGCLDYFVTALMNGGIFSKL